MNAKLLLIVLIVLAGSCQPKKQATEEEVVTEEPKPTVSLTKKWETEPLLTTSESVVLDADNQVYYVSCIGSDQPWASDGTGFIAKVNLDGTVAEARWVDGLQAPKGLGISGNNLYVNDNEKFLTIDVATGEITNTIEYEEGTKLNDVAVGVYGEVYISDSESQTIYKIENNESTLFYQDTLIGGLNGIYAESDRLLLAGFGKGIVSTLDFNSKTLTQVADGMLKADGIESMGDGYFVSCWDGEIHYLDQDWNRTKILDTKSLEVRAADITVVPSSQLILVPTFFDNRLMAYEVSF